MAAILVNFYNTSSDAYKTIIPMGLSNEFDCIPIGFDDPLMGFGEALMVSPKIIFILRVIDCVLRREMEFFFIFAKYNADYFFPIAKSANHTFSSRKRSLLLRLR